MLLLGPQLLEGAHHAPLARRFGGTRARRVKHGLDRLAAGVALLLLAPLLLTVAVVIRLTSRGPAIYRQERVGLDGRPFSMWKFRTMTHGADAELSALLAATGRAGEPLFKIPADPRITPVGQWLRRWSLDELPQLCNVLAGQMSLVGPRPQVVAEVALYRGPDRGRLAVRPGITGLWQVSGRSGLAWREAIELDLRYVEHWTLGLDLWVLARTAGAVVSGRGAW